MKGENKMKEREEFYNIFKKTQEFVKDMGYHFSRVDEPNISVTHNLTLSKAKANRLIDYIDNVMINLNRDLENGDLSYELWDEYASTFQVLLFSVYYYAEAREALNWKITKTGHIA